MLQANAALGLFVCFCVMLGIYYSNTWDAKTQPFMSTKLRSVDGGKYPIAKIFKNGILDQEALATYGPPRLTGSFAYAMFMANAAVSVEIYRVGPSLTLHRSVLWQCTCSSSGVKTS